MYTKVIGAAFIILVCACNTQSGKKTGNESNKEAVPMERAKKTAGSPDYKPIPLPQLIGMSDLAVVGKVMEIRDETFLFRIDDYLTPRQDSILIEVTKYIAPAFLEDERIPYDSIQHFALFLRKLPRNNTPWTIIGIGGEGEMPVGDGNVYFNGTYLKGLEFGVHTVQGVEKNTQEVNLELFRDAVQNYTKCFTWKIRDQKKDDKTVEVWAPVMDCKESQIEEYRSKSWIHNYLASETLPMLHEDTLH